MRQPPQPSNRVTIVNHGKPIGVEPLTLQGLQSQNWLSSAGYSLALLSVGVIFPSAPVHATEPTQVGLNFSLSASLPRAVPVTSSADDITPSDTANNTGNDTTGNITDTIAIAPLAIPSEAIAPPLGKADTSQILPPPPVLDSEALVATDGSGLIQPDALDPPSSPNPTDQGDPDQGSPAQGNGTGSGDGALNFTLNLESKVSVAPSPPSIPLTATRPPLTSFPALSHTEPLTEPLPAEVQALFEGDENSQVAIAIGSAEGTRTPDGGKTLAYHGHVDPGNGVWNLGSFSYQHGAKSPEDADQRQLKRLTTQAQQLYQAAQTQGLTLSPQEFLNGLDLANQSPAAALSRGGYIDRLLEARQMGLQGDEAIAWARIRSFLDPDSQQWNAPGLGNTVEQISRDQERRMQAIAQTFVSSNSSSNRNRVKALYSSNRVLLPSSDTLVPTTQMVEQLLRLDLPTSALLY